jgi:hypothetical protein
MWKPCVVAAGRLVRGAKHRTPSGGYPVAVETFAAELAIIFATAAVLVGIWWTIRWLVRRAALGVAEATIAETRRHSPPATVAEGANAWSCANCRSVNRPDAIVCYRCRGDRASVEGLQGRI